LTVDFEYDIIVSVLLQHSESSITVAVASLYRECRFFLPSLRGEVMLMFVTWELLFLFAGFLIALLTYVDNHNKKN